MGDQEQDNSAEERYLKASIKEQVDECRNIDLLYLISGLLREDAV